MRGIGKLGRVARWLLPLALLSASPAVAQVAGVQRVQGVAGGSTLQPDATASASVSAACSDASINACGANQTVAVSMAGAQGFGFVVPAASTLVGTLKVDCSLDNGTTWINQSLLDSGGNATSSLVTVTSTTYSSSASVPGGARQCRIRAALFTSGSATITVIATAAASVGNAITTPDQTSSGLMSSACTTSTCSANQTVSIALVGYPGVSAQVTAASSPVGIGVAGDCSFDGGTTWQLAAVYFLPFTTGAWTTNTGLANSDIATVGSAFRVSLAPYCTGASHVRLRASTLTSGTVTMLLRVVDESPADGPSFAVVTNLTGGVPPLTAMVGGQDGVTATIPRPLQIEANNTTPANARFLLTLNAFSRSAVQAATAGNVAALSVDSTNGALNVRILDSASYLSPSVLANDTTAIANGLGVQPAVGRASTTALTAGRGEMLQLSSVTGALFTAITGSAAGGTPADVLATNTATGSGLGLLVNPGIGRSAVSGVTAGRVAAQAIDTTTGMQLVVLSDGASFLKVSVVANDTTAATNSIETAPAIARATPTATTAARAEKLQVAVNDGSLYISPSTYRSTLAIGTYRSTSGNTATAASATDVCYLSGSASKSIRVTGLWVAATQTAAGTFFVALTKRSTANSAGTCTNSTVVPVDSSHAAGTAVASACTANPTTGSLVGNIWSGSVFIPQSTTAAPFEVWPIIGGSGYLNAATIVLRGTAQVLAVNFNGATLTGGSISCSWEWTEE